VNASCAHPIAMRVRRAEMVRAVIDRCSVCERDVEWIFVGNQDWPGDALHEDRFRLREVAEWLATDMEHAEKKGQEPDDLARWRAAVSQLHAALAAEETP